MQKSIKDFLYYTLTEILLKVLGVLVYLYLGKIMIPDEFGYFAMATFVISFGSLLAQFGAGGMLIRDYFEKGGRFLAYLFMSILICAAVTSVIIFAFGNTITSLNGAFAALRDHPALLCGLILLTALSNIIVSYFIMAMKAKLYSYTIIVKSIAYMISVVLLINYQKSYVVMLYAQLISELAGFIVSIILVKDKVQVALRYSREIRVRTFVRYYRDATNYLSKDLLSIIFLYLSRIVLSVYIPVNELGIYSFFLNIYVSLCLVIAAIDRVYTPRVIKLYNANVKSTKAMINALFPAIFIGVISVYLIGIIMGEKGMYTIVFKAAYAANSYMLNTILFLLVVTALLQMFSFSYYIGDNNNSARDHTFLYVLFAVMLQILLIPRYFITGALVAELCTIGFRFISLRLINKNIIGKSVNGWIDAVFLVYSIASIALYATRLVNFSGLVICILLGIVLYASFSYRNILLSCRALAEVGGLREVLKGIKP